MKSQKSRRKILNNKMIDMEEEAKRRFKREREGRENIKLERNYRNNN